MSKHRRGSGDGPFPDRPTKRLKEFEPDSSYNSHSPTSNGSELILSRALSGDGVIARSSASQVQGIMNRPEHPSILISDLRDFVIKDATLVSFSQESDTTLCPFIDSPEGKKIRKALVKNLDIGALPDRCLPGTRVTILDEVDARIINSENHNIIWIKGFPGVGKSAVASTIISRLQERGQLLSCFVFDRARPTVTTTRALWRQVAWDFARLFPPTRKALLRCIDDEPVGINIPGIISFFMALIEQPLSHLSDSMFGPHSPAFVIVIDAVDECGGLDGSRSKDRKDLLATLEQWHSKLPQNIKIILTSREEDDLKRRLSPISSLVDFSTTTDEDFRDIHAYLLVRLGGIAESSLTSLPDDWVNETAIYLAKRAEGVFVWATTAANYIECGEPRSQLNNIRSGLGLGGEGGTLFSLYGLLLKTSFKNMREKQREAFKSVTGAMIFAQRPFYDAEFTAISPIISTTMLQYIRIGLRSVVARSGELRFSHPSFADFLLSPECPDDFAINQSERQGQLTMLCLTTMSIHLRFNICGLETSYLRNMDIPDIEAKIKRGISSLLSYSCCFVADHLSRTTFGSDIPLGIQVLLKEKFLFWLEAMSLLGEINRTVPILKAMLSWISGKDENIMDFLRDARRFITAFSTPITQSAPHIYLSALPFAPDQSLITQHFLYKFPKILKFTIGKADRWSSCLFISIHPAHTVRIVTGICCTSDESLFASESYEGTICVWDNENGNLISGPFCEDEDIKATSISFSPDGKYIVGVDRRETGSAYVWDVKTGKTHLRLNSDPTASQIHIRSVTFSRDGRFIVSVSRDLSNSRQSPMPPSSGYVQLWDTESGALVKNLLEGLNPSYISALSDGGDLFAVWTTKGVAIWDLANGMASRIFEMEVNQGDVTHWLTPVAVFPTLLVAVHEDSPGGERKMLCIRRTNTGDFIPRSTTFPCSNTPSLWAYSPENDALILCFKVDGLIVIINPTTGDVIHEFKEPASPHGIHPSGNGRHMLVGYNDGTIRMWDYQERIRETLTTSNRIDSSSAGAFPAFSPDGQILAACCEGRTRLLRKGRGEIRLWNTATGEVLDGIGNDIQSNDSAPVFSTDGCYIASIKTRSAEFNISEPMIRIWDTKTGMIHRQIAVGQAARKLCQFFFRSSDNRLILGAIHLPEGDENAWAAVIRVWGDKKELDSDEPCTATVVFRDNWPRSGIRHFMNKDLLLSPDTLTAIVLGEGLRHCRRRTSINDEFTTHADFDASTFQRWISKGAEFSPSGRLFTSLAWDESDDNTLLRVWETETWKVIAGPIEVDPDWVSGPLAITPNDRFVLCSIGYDIRVWDIHTGHLIAGPWYSHEFTPIHHISVSPGGERMVSTAPVRGSYVIQLWDIQDLYTAQAQAPAKEDFRDESIVQDGWVLGSDGRSLLFWVPVERRAGIYRPRNTVVITDLPKTKLDFTNFKYGREWGKCIDKTWL
ncbi:hypothetical protein NP233_g867 [Leucocoprinus birnbaumii]|uniref:Nephrocystin 3-like N-terminal domain-containing protein n=1 Tax=Leucocoprinus birnbaumii TaxID=56174 RepID=A0AAD5W245_9AGAR|nr:hypothetical protein NP233_g867 [Leucocoprinus birnbaumii]